MQPGSSTGQSPAGKGRTRKSKNPKLSLSTLTFFLTPEAEDIRFLKPPGLIVQFMWGKKSEIERTSIGEDQLLGLQNPPLPLSHEDTVSFLPSLVNKATAGSGQKD